MFYPLKKHVILKKAIPIEHTTAKRGRNYGESKIQKSCVRWLRERGVLVQHLKQGSKSYNARRNDYEMGCTLGAADIVIFDRVCVPGTTSANGFNRALAVEFKTLTGKQSDDQKRWQAAVERRGWAYRIVRSLTEMEAVAREFGLPTEVPMTMEGV
jgi:hypothetical protein